ncbi:CrcB family protein [Aquimonas voraii]|uniref:Fluoride-specific ion channel FluC n=1 Tax=Aquimonas voraii TaxID=265719 RepID=A0A1G6S231_9GAMM|nr:CrcB family protein [Aquimonas voraii]SDD10972.1 camphor resistance protein CrcB [Aquimonas voraii]
MSLWSSLGLVMAGGALGAGARFLLGTWLLRQLGSGFPWGTFAVNLLGSFGAGLLLVWVQKPEAAPWLRPLLMTGLLGGLTTYSALMVDCLLLWRELERPGLALLYLALTLVIGFAALLGGWLLGQGLRG